MKHKILTLLLAIVASTSTLFAVSGTCGDNLTWNLTGDGVLTISGTGAMSNYTSSSPSAPWYSNRSSIKSVVIEDGVTNIGNYAFAECRNLTSVTIPNSVTSIGGRAFSRCKGLTSVTIPNSVTSIGGSAFYGCSSLTSATIGNSVTSIGDYAFEDCTGLTSVTINSDSIVNKNYSSSSNVMTIFGQQVQNYVIGDSITGIGSYAFSGSTSLKSLTIGKNVAKIFFSSFYYCDSLTSVTINSDSIMSQNFNDQYNLTTIFGPQVENFILGDNITRIGERAFYNCSSLTSVTIGNSVTSIGDETFYGCSGLTSVVIGNSVTSIESYAFYNCTSLASVTIPNSVTSIGVRAFYGCSSLATISIGNSVSSIADNAFAGCTGLPIVDNLRYADTYLVEAIDKSLSTYTIKEGTKWIGSSAFSGCTGLTSIEIPNSVTSIGDNAFYECTSLTSVVIGNSVISIEPYAFYNCTSLASVTIPNSVTSIGSEAFAGCSGLTSVTIPNSVTSIGYAAFLACTGLTSIDIPNSVTSIGGSAFSHCTGLTSVVIGNSVTSIESYAFYNCTSLASVTIPNSVTSIGVRAFYECTSLTSVVIGNSVTSIGFYAFYNCSNLNSITIGNSVTSIEGSAFEGCEKLASVIWNARACNDFDANYTPFYDRYLNGDHYIYSYDLRPYITSFKFGEDVKHIPAYLCSGMNKFDSINIPDSVTSIGENAFFIVYNINYSGDAIGGPWGALHWNHKPTILSTTAIKEITSQLSGNETSSLYYRFTGVISSIKEVNTQYGNASFYVTDGTTSFYCYRIYDYYSTLFTSSDQLHVGDSVVISSKVQNYLKDEHYYPEAVNGRLQYHSANLLFTPDSVLYYGVRTDASNEAKLYYTIDQDTLNIPSTVTYNDNEYTVTEIASGGIYNVQSIRCAIIPQTIKYLSKNFEKCDNLKTVIINSNNILGKTYTTDNNMRSLFGSQVTEYVLGDNVTSIGDNAFYNCSNLLTIGIPNSVTSIGKSAFEGCSALSLLILHPNITSYGERAFYNCTALKTIYNYRETPAPLGAYAFRGVDYFNCKLYVPAKSLDMYKSSGSDWKDFYFIEPIEGATEITLNNREVLVDAGDETALFTWPIESKAGSYTLVIKKGETLFCTLTFDGDGRLTRISFAPSRNGTPHSSTATTSIDAMQFTVTGLDIATNYSYALTVKDVDENILASYSGTFGTTGAEGVEDVEATLKSQKILRDNQVLILRGEKTYTITGQEVK